MRTTQSTENVDLADVPRNRQITREELDTTELVALFSDLAPYTQITICTTDNGNPKRRFICALDELRALCAGVD